MSGRPFPPVGPLDLGSPPSPVLWLTKTSTSPLDDLRLSLARRYLEVALFFLPQSGQRATTPHRATETLSIPNPHFGFSPRRKVDLPGSRVSPVRTCPVLRPRRFLHTTAARRVSYCLPDAPSRRLNRDYTHFGAPEPQPVRSILPVPHPELLRRTRDSLLPSQRTLGRWDFLFCPQISHPLGNTSESHITLVPFPSLRAFPGTRIRLLDRLNHTAEQYILRQRRP
jgi:hypothetical protein